MLHHARTWAGVALTLTVVLLSLSVVSAQDVNPNPVGLRPDAPPYAVHGPYWVGVKEFTIPDPDGKRELSVSVWYPALNPKGTEASIDYSQFYTYFGDIIPDMTGHALLNAAPDQSGAPYPEVIHSPGSVAVKDQSPWLVENLASFGFVVLAPEHPGDTAENFFAMIADHPDVDAFVNGQILEYTQRPQDMRRTVDFADALTAKGGALEGLIDTEKIAVSGYSMGSYTALMAAGARLDLAVLKTWCAAHPDLLRKGWFDTPIEICQLIDQPELQTTVTSAIGIQAPLNGLWPPLNDPRVDAVVSIATCYAMAFGTDGAQALNVPILMLGASNDSSCPPEYMGDPLYENVGSAAKAKVVFEDAGHSIFNWKCSESFIEAGWFDFCSDPVWDMDRAHDLTNHFTTAFLLDVLKGDEDAHTALLPEYVSFPGIAYETTMK